MSERASFSEATPAVSVSRRSVAIVAATLAITFLTPPLFAEAPVTAPISDAEVFGTTRDAFGIDRGEAERIFASSEAAIYFPALGRARWFDVAGGNARFDDGIAESLQGFRDRLDHDFPGLRANAFGPWLMKSPAIARSVSVATSSASITPSAAAFSDSFESGLVNWDTSNNTLDLYDWGTTTCEARSGSRSADALRGGVNSLSCADSYASNVETTMIHNACEAITAADEAWLDLYVHVATESGYDTLGLFYAGSDQRYGYTFSGTWSAWFHVVFNLKQWYRVGDVTASTCPNLMIQFESDSDTEPGIGARIDDLTISTSAPSFLACAITASPASGAAPLTVSFTPAVNGASGSTVYLWSFGDAAGTTAATSASSFTYTEPGDYQVRLRVENQGIRAYAHKTIHVTSGSACSLSCTALVPASASAGSPAAFQSTATATGCSESPTFSWNFGDGQTSSQQNPSHTYPSSGTYSWTLTTRASGQSCTRSGSITVSSSGTKPRSRPVRRSDDTIASATIGTSGGTLVGGGFKLTVPAGAFSANASLTLSRVATPQLDRGEVSDKFRLSGTPEAIAKDLTLEIELPSSTPPLTSGQRYYVSVDAPAYVEHSVAKAPFRLLATVNSRKLGVTIPKSWTALSKVTAAGLQTAPEFDDDDHPDLDLQAIISTTFETTHFTASVLPYAASNTPAILNLLEAHFKRLEDSGFSFACRVDGQTFRKIEVVPWFLGTAKDDPLGEHVSRSSPCGSGWIFNDYLVVTLSYPATDKSVDYAAGHELFHLLQDIYSPGGATANLWLKEASSIWYELIVGNPCPTVQSANTFFPWNGLFNSKKSAVEPGTKPTDLEAHHGYGASYLLFRRTKSLSDPFVLSIWNSIKGGSNEFDAVEKAFGGWSSLKSEWSRFARDFFDGKMSTEGCPVTFRGAGDAFPKVELASADSLPRAFTTAVYPLSAKSWVVDLKTFTASTAQPATLTATGLIANQSVFVYDTKAQADLAELTPQNPSYAIADLNATKGGALVMVIVDTNSPLPPDPNVQSSTNSVELSIGSNEGFKTVTKRENAGAGDTAPTTHAEWVIEPAAGAWRDPTKNALVWVSGVTINLKGRVIYKAPAPDFTTCDSKGEWCSEFKFLGFTGTEELWNSHDRSAVATATSAGAWMQVTGYTLPFNGSSYYFEEFVIKVYFTYHSKIWNQKTGEVREDLTRTANGYAYIDIQSQ